MAAYYKVDVSLSTNSVTVGAPSPQEVIVTLPLVGPAGAVGATGATGATGPAGSGIEILTTQGDLLYRGASDGQRLPIGTSGQVLKVSGGIPAWGAESGAVSSVAGRTGAITLAVADVANAVATSDSRLSDSRTPLSHTHGNLTNAGAIGTTSGLPVKTGTSGVIEAGAFGTSAGQFAEGNHTHAASAITSGVLDNARVNFAAPAAIGSTTPAAGNFTTLTLKDSDTDLVATFDAYGNLTANRTYALPDISGTLALSPAETYYNITATNIGSPQQIDLSGLPFVEATEVRSVLNNDTGIVYVQIFLPIDSPSIVPKLRFYGQIGGAGDILYIQLIRDSVVVFPASGSGYEELNNGETLEVVWNGTSYGLTPNAPFMRRITLPDASGTLALLETLPAGGTKTYATFTAPANQPTASAFARLDTRNSIAVLDFTDTSTESAVFVGVIPEAASLGSGLIVSLRWMATTATSGDVRWSVAWEKSNTDLDSDSFDTATAATVTTNGTSGIVTVTNITCTTIDSLAAGDLFRLRVQRIGGDGADTMTGDAELVAVEIRSAA
jgi:hypothetical protein